MENTKRVLALYYSSLLVIIVHVILDSTLRQNSADIYIIHPKALPDGQMVMKALKPILRAMCPPLGSLPLRFRDLVTSLAEVPRTPDIDRLQTHCEVASQLLASQIPAHDPSHHLLIGNVLALLSHFKGLDGWGTSEVLQNLY